MNFAKIDENKKKYLDLLLLADEQENMIDAYLERGTLYVLTENELTVAVCVVTDEGDGLLEIKNLAVAPNHQRKGYGRAVIAFVVQAYKNQHRKLQVGTGEVPSSTQFYEACGLQLSHRIANFFTDHYDHPMYEDGIQLVDMVYFSCSLAD